MRPPPDPDTFSGRLMLALETSRRTRKELQAVLRSSTGELGVSASAIAQALNGTGALSAENSARAARFLGVDGHWLATGEGEMRHLGAGEMPSHYGARGGLVAAVIQLGAALAEVPERNRRVALALLDGLATQPSEAQQIGEDIEMLLQASKVRSA